MTQPTSFDLAAKNWDADQAKVARAEQVATAILRDTALQPHWRALEYGCGTGLLSFALQAHLQHITLADSSQGMLAVLQDKIAAQQMQNMHPMALDLTSEQHLTERFELIYSLMTLHHIPDTQQLLKAFWQALESGGTLALCDLDAEDGSFHGPNFDGHLGFERNALQSQAEKVGFRNIRFQTVFTIEKPNSPGQTRFPLFLMLADK